VWSPLPKSTGRLCAGREAEPSQFISVWSLQTAQPDLIVIVSQPFGTRECDKMRKRNSKDLEMATACGT
jgi:hypothetical protein